MALEFLTFNYRLIVCDNKILVNLIGAPSKIYIVGFDP